MDFPGLINDTWKSHFVEKPAWNRKFAQQIKFSTLAHLHLQCVSFFQKFFTRLCTRDVTENIIYEQMIEQMNRF